MQFWLLPLLLSVTIGVTALWASTHLTGFGFEILLPLFCLGAMVVFLCAHSVCALGVHFFVRLYKDSPVRLGWSIKIAVQYAALSALIASLWAAFVFIIWQQDALFFVPLVIEVMLLLAQSVHISRYYPKV